MWMTRVRASVECNLRSEGPEADLHFCIMENSGTFMRNCKIEESEQVLVDGKIEKFGEDHD